MKYYRLRIKRHSEDGTETRDYTDFCSYPDDYPMYKIKKNIRLGETETLADIHPCSKGEYMDFFYNYIPTRY